MLYWKNLLWFKLKWMVLSDTTKQCLLKDKRHETLVKSLFDPALILKTPLSAMETETFQTKEFETLAALNYCLSATLDVVASWRHHKDNMTLTVPMEINSISLEQNLKDFTTVTALASFIPLYLRCHSVYLELHQHSDSRVRLFTIRLGNVLAFCYQLMEAYHVAITK